MFHLQVGMVVAAGQTQVQTQGVLIVSSARAQGVQLLCKVLMQLHVFPTHMLQTPLQNIYSSNVFFLSSYNFFFMACLECLQFIYFLFLFSNMFVLLISQPVFLFSQLVLVALPDFPQFLFIFSMYVLPLALNFLFQLLNVYLPVPQFLNELVFVLHCLPNPFPLFCPPPLFFPQP